MEPFKPMTPMKPLRFSEPVRWWPEDLGSPSSLGSQNNVHYAYFRAARRLLLRHGKEITAYDTGDHDISGVAQASDISHARFFSNLGEVDLKSLKRI
jgi:hypothetical protein